MVALGSRWLAIPKHHDRSARKEMRGKWTDKEIGSDGETTQRKEATDRSG